MPLHKPVPGALFLNAAHPVRKVSVLPAMQIDRLELVVFDLDGVLIDSEPLHEIAKREALASFGITGPVDLSWSVGRPQRELWQHLIDEYGLEKDPAELERRQYESILDQMRDKRVALSAGLVDLLDCLQARGIRTAVCSSSDRFYVDRFLVQYQLRDRFTAVVGGDEVPQKKPAPDGYLRALQLSGVAPGRAVAIEDTRAGSLAARAAGMACIGYRNPTSGSQDLTPANLTVGSLAEAAAILCPAAGARHPAY